MDHLPLPREPLLDPIGVPYRCTEPYDGGPMLHYPERNGWLVLHTPTGISYLIKGKKPSAEQLESFIQNYIYFGLLYETFGKFTDISNFITENKSGQNVITTAPLEECLGAWAKQVEDQQDADSSEETDWWKPTHKLLRHAWKIVLNTKKRKHNGTVDERIWFSIAVLAESIEQVILDLFRDPMLAPSGIASWRTPQNSPIGKFILDEMLRKGWCNFDVHRIDLTTKGAATLYFLGNLQPTRPGHDHSTCTKDLCMWMMTNDSYKTRHAAEDCHCKSHFSGIQEVRRVLEEGDEIPVIQEIRKHNTLESSEFQIIQGVPSTLSETFTQDTSESPGFRVVRGGSSTPGAFIAISHVWAEGLGNPIANELPNCSLKWISDMVTSLSPKSEDLGTPFWIDTLCVPIQPKHLWQRAMNRLRKPYTDAAFVLVLDSYLYTQDSNQLSPLEVWARVLCCSWSRRLWTFQEGRLAKTLLYQFADRAITLEEMFLNLGHVRAASSMRTEMRIAYHSSNIVKNVEKWMPDYQWKVKDASKIFRLKPDVRDMRESLKARSVSFSFDEALCLFCNMGFDMEFVTGLANEERMPKFWTQVENIPVGLIFSMAREKLTQLGLHWAPASFMGDMDKPHWYLEQAIQPRVDGHPTPEGLEIQVPAFLFDNGLLKHDDSFDIAFSDCWFHVQDREDGTWYWVEMSKEFWNQSRKEDPKAGEKLAILIHEPVDALEEDTNDEPFSSVPGLIAVIGVITEPASEDRRTKIELYRHARFHKFSRALQEYNSLIQIGVEKFVAESLGYTCEAGHDEHGRFLERLKPPPCPEGEKPKENLENFEDTYERRALCQRYCMAFAQENKWARNITLLCGAHEGRTPQRAFEHFAACARVFFHMRRRNRVRRLPQTQLWCID